MPSPCQQFGAQAEALVAGYLKKQGYRILEHNYRTRFGEIDIIAQHRDVIVFVEVKARKTARYTDPYMDPKWSVTPKKQRRIAMAAQQYLKTTLQSQSRARFDVVTVLCQSPPHIELYQNAFNFSS
jgi:putative endonuclease